jgi:hypothetical protein
MSLKKEAWGQRKCNWLRSRWWIIQCPGRESKRLGILDHKENSLTPQILWTSEKNLKAAAC